MNNMEQMKMVGAVAPFLHDNEAWTPVAIDTKGYSHLRVLIYIGVTDIATVAAPKLTTCATSDGSYDLDVTGAVLGSAISGTDDGKLFAIDVNLSSGQNERYFNLTCTSDDGSSGINVCAIAILSNLTSGSHNGLATAAGLEELVSV